MLAGLGTFTPPISTSPSRADKSKTLLTLSPVRALKPWAKVSGRDTTGVVGSAPATDSPVDTVVVLAVVPMLAAQLPEAPQKLQNWSVPWLLSQSQSCRLSLSATPGSPATSKHWLLPWSRSQPFTCSHRCCAELTQSASCKLDPGAVPSAVMHLLLSTFFNNPPESCHTWSVIQAESFSHVKSARLSPWLVPGPPTTSIHLPLKVF
mmetsp:Transcript_22762/g.52665  ORF Transcript_22762/g.52665 Transcript_22762/m.52665 type:complete len:207 (+) Transcript_22762:1581-2201(+)